MIAYKLFKERKDGSIGSLFVKKTDRLPFDTWLDADKSVKPKTLKYRPFWHCMSKEEAPHLSTEGRVWCLVQIDDYEEMQRPECQGGKWYLANKIKIIGKLK